jgi:hypothetical protein
MMPRRDRWKKSCQIGKKPTGRYQVDAGAHEVLPTRASGQANAKEVSIILANPQA